MTISNCGSYRAGGAFFQYSSPALVNVTVSGCSAIYGGGIEFFESSPRLLHVTISGGFPSGIFCSSNSHVSLENSILWNNTLSQVEFSGDLSPNSITISYSDIENGQGGVTTNDNGTVNWLEGNIDADPLFADSENGGYHLADGSPCIDAGTDAGVYTDIDGDLRPLGAGFDMGSDESTGGE